MANFFDQADPPQEAAPASPAPTAAVGGNFFDQVDPPEQPGFIQRVKTDYAGRVANAQALADQGVEGKQTMAETIPEMGVQLVGGPINDVVKEGINTLVPPIMEGATAIPGLQSYSDAWNKSVGPLINDAASHAAQLYHQLPQRVQNAGDALGTTGQAALTVVPAMSIASKVGPTVGDAASAIAKVPGAVSDAITPATPIPASKDLFTEGDKAYTAANAAGAGGTSQATNSFLSQANKTAAQDPLLMQSQGPDAAQKYLAGLNNLADQPLPLSTAQSLDIDLRENANQAYRSGQNSLGARYNAMRTALRDNIYNNPDPAQFTGGPEGFQALQEGNRLYSQGYALEPIENIISNGLKAEVPQTAIKNGFKTLANNIAKNGTTYSPETVDAINTAAQTGALTGILKHVGSKLVTPLIAGGAGAAVGSVGGPVGTALGSVVGSGAGYLAGAPFRAAATGIQVGKGEDVLRSIVDNPKYTPVQISEMPPDTAMKMLPPPQYEMAVDSAGNAAPTLPNQAGRQEASDLGLTPDVQKNISRLELRQKMDPVFDQIEQEKQSQIDQAFNQNPQPPITDLIDQGKQSAEDFAAAKGEEPFNPALKDALLRAKTAKEIADMSPADAIKYLNSLKGR